MNLKNEGQAKSKKPEDNIGLKMKGDIIDKIMYKDGRVEYREGHNLVVNSFLKLAMCLLKEQSGYSGIQYWAVGSGASTWDSDTPDPALTETKLTAEVGRKAIPSSAITFLDSDFNTSSTPTNIIQIVLTFGENDCNGKWREFGIFGGNATTTANSGVMINKKHHDVLTKTSDMVIERTMRFTLSLS